MLPMQLPATDIEDGFLKKIRGRMRKKTTTPKAKPKKAKPTPRVPDLHCEECAEDEKIMRLAHKILTKTIWPAKLSVEQAVEVGIVLLKANVVSNTSVDDPDDRAELVEL